MYAKEKGCLLTGTEDMNVEFINVIDDNPNSIPYNPVLEEDE
jgi:hypothetical protein